MATFRPWFIIRNAVTIMLMKLNIGDPITEEQRDLMHEFVESYDRKVKLIESYTAECNKEYALRKALEDENIALADEVHYLKGEVESLKSTVKYHKEMKVAFRDACGDQRKEIDALKVKLAAVMQHRDALVSDHDNMLAALRVIENATGMTLSKLEQFTQEVK